MIDQEYAQTLAGKQYAQTLRVGQQVFYRDRNGINIGEFRRFDKYDQGVVLISDDTILGIFYRNLVLGTVVETENGYIEL
jgi:hypothetical protein